MNGFDMKKYHSCIAKANEYDMLIESHGEKISLKRKDGRGYGMFPDMDTLYNFLCGYEWGYTDNNSFIYSTDLLQRLWDEYKYLVSEINNVIVNDNYGILDYLTTDTNGMLVLRGELSDVGIDL